MFPPNGWFLIALDRNTTTGLASTIERVNKLSLYFIIQLSTNLKLYTMIKLMFVWLVLTGQVEYQQKGEDGRKQYALFFEDGKVIDYAYKQEIYEYIQTGTFEYDDTLDDKVTEEHKGE